ncbi:MAG: hypothetical protein IPM38_14480 [Ignavibacteria bacterium]|nr:hypothetical protein [Ignavibacteria bacterium]
MLFNQIDNLLESEKERNLYYKFFCGYYFNELVDGFNERITNFNEIINTQCIDYINSEKLNIQLSAADSHVTFDVHSYLICKTDRGELADIFIMDNKNKICIAIEAKFLTDWGFVKDVVQNSIRIKSCSEKLKDYIFIQCLLIKESKWNEVIKLKNHPSSNYTRLKNQTEIPLFVLTWETLINSVPDENIKITSRIIGEKQERFSNGIK